MYIIKAALQGTPSQLEVAAAHAIVVGLKGDVPRPATTEAEQSLLMQLQYKCMERVKHCSMFAPHAEHCGLRVVGGGHLEVVGRRGLGFHWGPMTISSAALKCVVLVIYLALGVPWGADVLGHI